MIDACLKVALLMLVCSLTNDMCDAVDGSGMPAVN